MKEIDGSGWISENGDLELIRDKSCIVQTFLEGFKELKIDASGSVKVGGSGEELERKMNQEVGVVQCEQDV